MEDHVRAPTAVELPTTAKLNRATLISAALALALLVTTVLPAEYGVDPTGIGRLLGLTPMGEMKRQQAAAGETTTPSPTPSSKEAASAPAPTPAATTGGQAGEVTLTLAPDEGREVKATMRAGGEFQYVWSTGGPQVNFELHGEEVGASGDDYTSYEKGTSAGESGTFRAPFDGTHGWYWRNRTEAPLTITVRATGAFEKFELLAE